MKQNKSPKTTEGKKALWFVLVLVVVAAAFGWYIWKSTSGVSSTANSYLPSVSADGAQEVRMSVNGLDYEPSVLTVRSGQKVRWFIDATNAAGCAHSLVSPAIGVQQMLKSGQNVIEFTPTKPGIIKFSCSMGMARGQFQVI